MDSILKKEFEYFLGRQEELVKMYEGKFVVIKDQHILGAYDSEIDAIEETSKTEEMGTFLVQKCERGDSSFTQTFHSRVSIG